MSGQYPNTFYRVSVKGVCLDSARRVLVVKEMQDTWSLPGGGLDHGEDPKKALRREYQEELGVKADAGELVTTRTFLHPSKQAWLMWVIYSVKLQTNKFTPGEGVTQVEYLPIDQLDDGDVFEATVKSVVLELTSATLR